MGEDCEALSGQSPDTDAERRDYANSIQEEWIMNEEKLRRDICEVGRRMYARHLISGVDGNISVLREDGTIMTTPTGMSKGFLEPDDLVITDGNGKKLSGKREPS